MTRAATALAGLALLALPATAAAQVPTPTPTPTPPAPTPTPTPTPPPPPQAKGALKLTTKGAFGAGRQLATLKGRTVRIRGVLRPFVAGQKVTVRIYRNGKRIKTRSFAPKPVPGNQAATFQLRVGARKSGRLAVQATHKATPLLATVRAKTVRVQVVLPRALPGERSPAVSLLQTKLGALHYVVPHTGVYDAGTQRAVMAWRKVAGLSRTYIASKPVFTGLLRGRGRFHVRHPGDGRHAEARLGKQVLALIDGGKVRRIYHTSSGKPSTPTVLGRYKVYRKDLGTNGLGMVDASYFVGGYAIHGYVDVPAFNASHGCLRIPIPDARYVFDWVDIGDKIYVEP
jgi:peptidoglycan hydrolase-like protein with peptidoglycan-binding domain